MKRAYLNEYRVVQKVYNEKNLTEEDVVKLNPGRDAKEVFAELVEVKMSIIETDKRTQDLIQRLLMVWEKSVRETHLFLSDAEIENIKKYVPEALKGVFHLIIANDEEGYSGKCCCCR